jgi:hypothetical protein
MVLGLQFITVEPFRAIKVEIELIALGVKSSWLV